MNNLHPVFQEIVDGIIPTKKELPMNKEYKELYDLVMMYVDEKEKHHLDDQALEEELQIITETIEELAFDIENGKYDVTHEDLKSMHEEAKFDQMRDDEITERSER